MKHRTVKRVTPESIKEAQYYFEKTGSIAKTAHLTAHGESTVYYMQKANFDLSEYYHLTKMKNGKREMTQKDVSSTGKLFNLPVVRKVTPQLVENIAQYIRKNPYESISSVATYFEISPTTIRLLIANNFNLDQYFKAQIADRRRYANSNPRKKSEFHTRLQIITEEFIARVEEFCHAHPYKNNKQVGATFGVSDVSIARIKKSDFNFANYKKLMLQKSKEIRERAKQKESLQEKNTTLVPPIAPLQKTAKDTTMDTLLKELSELRKEIKTIQQPEKKRGFFRLFSKS